MRYRYTCFYLNGFKSFSVLVYDINISKSTAS